MKKFDDLMFALLLKKLDFMQKHPDKVSAEQLSFAESLLAKVKGALSISDHVDWKVECEVRKYHNEKDLSMGKHYDVAHAGGNIVTDSGANAMLKLITGDSLTSPFSNANAVIAVGNNTTPENATQTGLIAIPPYYVAKGMDSGFPQVTGRNVVFKSTFNNDEANFSWNEFSIQNGIGSNKIALNRKVENLGTKATGIWTVQITISIVSTPSV